MEYVGSEYNHRTYGEQTDRESESAYQEENEEGENIPEGVPQTSLSSCL